MTERIHQTRLPTISRSREVAAQMLSGAEREVAEFRRLVASSGGKIPPRSPLMLSLEQYISASRFLASDRHPTPSDVSDLEEAQRVQFVVRSTLAAAGHPVQGLDAKLRKISGEDVIIAGACREQSTARDTMWEIVTAGLCSKFGHEVAMLETADDSSPDVGCTFAGARWCIECKMLRTQDAQQQRNRLVKAAKQIQGYAEAERGVVFANLTDTLFHAPWSQPSQRTNHPKCSWRR